MTECVVDLVGFGQLGRRVAAALAEQGVDVQERSADEADNFETHAVVVVLALGRVPEAHVRRICDRPARRYRVLVIGRRRAEAADLDCEAFLSVALSAREIAKAVLSHAIRTGSYQPPPLPDDAPPSADAVSIAAPPGPSERPERTMELVHPEVEVSPYALTPEPADQQAAHGSAVSQSASSTDGATRPRRTTSRRRKPEAEHAKSGTPQPRPQSEPASGTTLSTELIEAIRAAGRRIFGVDQPSDWTLGRADEDPMELVPPELLEEVELALDVWDGDPFDALAEASPLAVDPNLEGSEDAPGLAGTLLQPQAEAITAESLVESHESQHATTLNEPPVGQPTPEGGRRGELTAAELMRLGWWTAEQRGDVRLAISRGDGTSIQLQLLGGAVIGFVGPVALGVADRLRARGRATATPASEADARNLLKELERSGRLGDLELAALEREVREDLLGEILASQARAPFDLQGSTAGFTDKPPVFARSFVATLIEQAARRIGIEEVQLAAGRDAWGIRLTPTFTRCARLGELAPEVVHWLGCRQEVALAPELRSVDAELGLPGIVWALWTGGAVEWVPARDRELPADSVNAARAAVEAAARLAEDANYFVLLGVPPRAQAREVREAYMGRRRQLAALPLGALGLDAHEVLRAAAVDALDEAYETLRNPALREAYRAALGL